MGREDMRAGDSDRQAVADQLKTALDEGRLDLSEYDERIQKTYGARTYADLSGLLDDLPGTVPVTHSQVTPAPPAAAAPAPSPDRSTAGQLAHWVGPYGGVITVCVIIWVITSATSHRLQYFWPVWMLIPLVLGVVGQWFGHENGAANRARDARRAARRERRNR